MAKVHLANKLPHFGLFLFIALAITLELTVFSIQNVSTNIQQNAAVPKGCYYAPGVCPKFACRQGLPCPTCAPKLVCPNISITSVPTPTCIQRPPCLNSHPACKIAEPSSGWCPIRSTTGL